MMKNLGNGVRVPMTAEEEAAHLASLPDPVEVARTAQLQTVEIELTKRYDSRRVDQLLNKKIDATITVDETTELNNLLGVFEHYVVVKDQLETDPDPLSVITKSGWPV